MFGQLTLLHYTTYTWLNSRQLLMLLLFAKSQGDKPAYIHKHRTCWVHINTCTILTHTKQSNQTQQTNPILYTQFASLKTQILSQILSYSKHTIDTVASSLTLEKRHTNEEEEAEVEEIEKNNHFSMDCRRRRRRRRPLSPNDWLANTNRRRLSRSHSLALTHILYSSSVH